MADCCDTLQWADHVFPQEEGLLHMEVEGIHGKGNREIAFYDKFTKASVVEDYCLFLNSAGCCRLGLDGVQCVGGVLLATVVEDYCLFLRCWILQIGFAWCSISVG